MGLTVILLLSSAVEAFLSGIIFLKKGHRKYNPINTCLIWLTVYISAAFFLLLFTNLTVKIIVTAVIKLILILLLFEGEAVEKLKFYGFIELISFLCEAGSFGLCAVSNDKTPSLFEKIGTNEPEFLILSQIIFSAATALIIQLNVEKRISKYIISIQMIICVSEATLLLYAFSNQSFSFERGTFALGIVLVSVVLINVLANILLPDFINKNFDYQSSDFNQKITEMEYEYYTIACENNRKTREMQHDIANHMQTLYMLFNSEEQEKGLKYIKDLFAEYKTIPQQEYCNNPIVNIILMTKQYEAKQKGIDVTFNVMFNFDKINITDMDISTIICNLLDNAIRGSVMSNCTYPKLSVEILEKNGYLVIRVVNSCDIKLTLDGETKIKSTKIGTQSGGFGMSIIMRTVKKYNGDFIVFARNGVFTATAIMSTKK